MIKATDLHWTRLLKIVTLVVLTASLARIAAYAETGTNAVQFLNLRPASKAESLGGAMTATGDDLSSLAINPATISRIRRPEAMFSQALLFEDIRFSYASYAQPTKWGMPSFEYLSLSYGDFENIVRDGQADGSQSPTESYFGLGWATKKFKGFFKDFNAGINLRYFSSDLDVESASGISANLGALYNTPFDGFSVGLAVNNLGSSVKFGNESLSQQRTVRLGFGYTTRELLALSSRARFSLDGVLPRDEGFHTAFGTEILFGSMV